jgi:hypothetical protein
MNINLCALAIAFVGSVVAVCGKTVEEGDKPLAKRMTKLGVVTLVVVIATFFVGFCKERHDQKEAEEQRGKSEQSQNTLNQVQKEAEHQRKNSEQLQDTLNQVQARLAKTVNANFIEGFSDRVETATKYDEGQWSKYISFRLSLRFLLYQLGIQEKMEYVKRMDNTNAQPPGITEMLDKLYLKGSIEPPLYDVLTNVAHLTYSAEWGFAGRAPPPTVEDLSNLRRTAPDALKKLEKKLEVDHSAPANVKTP